MKEDINEEKIYNLNKFNNILNDVKSGSFTD